MNVAILGANSHIAKGLIARFLDIDDVRLSLFTRSAAQTNVFLNSIGSSACVIREGYGDFLAGNFEVIINCIGAGTPKKLGHDYTVWFTLTEEYDNLCLAYLRAHSDVLYVNFSSGAIYGRDGTVPACEYTVNRIEVNHIFPADYYTIARLNSEVKHRAHENLNIVDLRVFAYFSRFADLNSGYFITEAVKCTKDKIVLKTGAANMVRDYIHPDDLFNLVLKSIESRRINAAFDVVSTAPAEKFQILDFLHTEYGLQYEVDVTRDYGSPNGEKNIYCSVFNRAMEIGYRPVYDAMTAIEQEVQHILRY